MCTFSIIVDYYRQYSTGCYCIVCTQGRLADDNIIKSVITLTAQQIKCMLVDDPSLHTHRDIIHNETIYSQC